MVSFICGACQDTIKKNKVDAHCRQCRNCWVLSCVDCCKDFQGEEFRAHNSCITEAEKYQGALYRPSGKKQAGSKADPQESWMESIRRLAGESGHRVAIASVLRTVSEYDNVPRKKTKFGNFLFNSVQVRDRSLIDELFQVIHAGWMADKPQPSDSSAKKEPSPEEVTPDTKNSSTEKCKKRRIDDAAVEDQPECKTPKVENKAGNKKLKKAIKKLLKKAESNSMKLKELHKLLQESEVTVDRTELKSFVKENSEKFKYSSKIVSLAQ